MRQTQTPSTLPEDGRVFSITLPDSEIFFALFAGALESLFLEWYWVKSDGGLTPDETIAAFAEAMQGVRYDAGIPD